MAGDAVTDSGQEADRHPNRISRVRRGGRACGRTGSRSSICQDCDRTRFPPMPSCPWCASAAFDVVESTGHGIVYSFVTAHVAVSPGYRGPLPYSVATVELTEGPRLLGRVEPSAPWPSGTGSSPVSPTISRGRSSTSSRRPSCPNRRRRTRDLSESRGRAGRGRLHAVHPGFGEERPGLGHRCRGRRRQRRRAATRRRRRHVQLHGLERLGALCRCLQHAGIGTVADRPRCTARRSSTLLTSSGRRPSPWREATPRWWWSTGPSTAARGHGRLHAIRRDGWAVPLPDRVRRLPDVRRHVGPAIPARDRAESRRSGCGGHRSAEVRAGQRARAPARAAALDAYLAEPFVVDPYRRSDCTVEVDGACAWW